MGVDQSAPTDERPAHEVRITRPFYLGRTEVTVGQWKQFVADTGFVTGAERNGFAYTLMITNGNAIGIPEPRASWKNPMPQQAFALTDDLPVAQVSWEEAEAFCGHFGFRLPTEAEWERACRAGGNTKYWWGEDPASGTGKGNLWDRSLAEELPSSEAFPFDDGHAFLAPVGSYAANAFGLCDMLGNVWEWCEDWYDAKFFREEGATQPDPVNRTPGKERVARGGSWSSGMNHCGCSHRGKSEPGYRNDRTGFRVAWTP